jgi:hypothetical protein
MGYRGKLDERRRARHLRGAGLPLAEIAARLGVSKSSVSLWVRDVPFQPLPRGTRGRRRQPNALQRRKQAEIDRLVAEGQARIGRLSDREFLVAGVALYAGEGGEVRQHRSPDDRLLLRLASKVLRDRRGAAPGSSLPARRARPGRRGGLLVGADRNPAVPVPDPYRAAADPSIRHTKHVHGCMSIDYSCSPTHRSIMGLISALLGDAVTPG